MLNPENIDKHPEQSDAIKREIAELRRRDEEEYHRDLLKSKERIQKHLDDHGGDLSLLLSHPVRSEIKAIQLSSFGTSKNIETVRIPLPLPNKNEVLIRSHSCGVNLSDIMMRQGLMDSWVRSLKPPFVLGSELAGEVVGFGRDAKGFKLGDRVVAFPERKAWGEYAVSRWDYCFKIPDEMNYHDAVALILNGIVAYSLVFELGCLRPNQCVLLHSAPGGLGNMIAQMARSVDNVRLFKIVANPKEESEWDRNTHYIGRDTDYVSEIRHVSPHGVDLVLDCEYEDNFTRDLNFLRPMGRYIMFGTHSAVTGQSRGFFESAKSWWGQEKISVLRLFEENKTISGFNLRHLMYFHRNQTYVRDVIEKVFEMWENGTIKPVFDCVLRLDDIEEGFQRLLEEGQTGKITLDPTMTPQESKHDRDYFVLAEKNVAERRKQSGGSKFRLPEAGQLVSDLEPKGDETPRQPSMEPLPSPGKQLEEQLARQHYFLKQYLTPEQQAQLEENREKLTPDQAQERHNEFLKLLNTEQQQEYWRQFQQPSSLGQQGGFTLTTTSLQPGVSLQIPPAGTGTGTEGLVHDQPPPYSVEKVISDLESSKLGQTGEITGGQPIYRKQEVEVTIPLTPKEVKQIEEEIPGQLAGHHDKPTFMEKLRDTFGTQQRNE